jgi:hypothetical protein
MDKEGLGGARWGKYLAVSFLAVYFHVLLSFLQAIPTSIMATSNSFWPCCGPSLLIISWVPQTFHLKS